MRPFAALIPLAFLVTRLAAAPVENDDSEDDVEQPTIFNGQPVPPVIQLSGQTYEEQVKDGYWLVKAFSPYCHHCKAMAPKWQTLYEFYYTSHPVAKSDESFTEFYNLRFAEINCAAFGTACTDLGVRSFPTMMLMQNGSQIKRDTGDAAIEKLSGYIESYLEFIKPGTRPSGGPIVPTVGAKDDGGLNKPADLPEIKDTPNPQGKSYAFTADTYDKLVKKTTDPWWIKFYAPWCHHCQAMAPSWSAMAREMQGKLNIGEVDCTKEHQLCKDNHVDAYPAMILFRGTERLEYNGLRGMGDLVSYAKHTVEAFKGVTEVSAASYDSVTRKQDVTFTYFYDHATTSEDFLALERFPGHVIGKAKFLKSADMDLARRFKVYTWPKLMVSRNGRTKFYPGSSPQQMRDLPRVIDWMHQNQLPLVPELTAENAQEIMDGTFVVLGILNRERSDEFASARRELNNAAMEWLEKQEKAYEVERQELRDAKQLRIDEAEDRNDERALRDAKGIRINMEDIRHKEVRFAWIDGMFWERWLKTTFGVSVKDGERVIINDQESRRYWDTTITGNFITPSRTAILDTLPKVTSRPPRISSKGVGSAAARAIHNAHRFISHHPWLAAGASVGTTVIAFIMWRLVRRRSLGISRIWSSSNGHGLFGDESKQGLLGLVTGQVNGSGNGKAD